MTKKLVIANWKMLPASSAEAQTIIEKTDEHVRGLDAEKMDVVICPPFIFIEEVASMLATGMLAGVGALGAQDIALSDAGAQTGEIGGAQLAALGVRYVIIGHSDRRWKLNESEETTNLKLKRVLEHGMVPVVCIGERTREGDWKGELAAQVDGTFRGLTAQSVARCIVAYEPVWAISTNPGAKPDSPASAVQAMGIIRDRISAGWEVSALFVYGGSVTPTNARDFLERPEVGGVLVGGASVRPDDFAGILDTAASL